MKSPEEQGELAFINGVPMEDCPYAVGTSDRADWQVSWINASRYVDYWETLHRAVCESSD